MHWPYQSVRLLGVINEHIDMYIYNKNAIIVVMSCIVYERITLKQSDTNSVISKRVGLCPFQGRAEELYEIYNPPGNSVVVGLLGCCIMCSAIELPDSVSRD